MLGEYWKRDRARVRSQAGQAPRYRRGTQKKADGSYAATQLGLMNREERICWRLEFIRAQSALLLAFPGRKSAKQHGVRRSLKQIINRHACICC